MHPNNASSAGRGLTIKKHDRRRTARFCTFSRPVGLHDGSVAAIARCRDLSDEGMRLAHSMPVERGQILEIAFSPVFSVRAEVVWVEGGECGVAFEEPLDAGAVIGDLVNLHRNSTAHHEVVGPRRITDAGEEESEADHKFRPGLHVKLRLARGPERSATVRWARNRGAALVLLDPSDVD